LFRHRLYRDLAQVDARFRQVFFVGMGSVISIACR